MRESHDFVFAILAFGRSGELMRLVNEIHGFFPVTRIVLLVDAYRGPDSSISKANKETIEYGRHLLSEGLITDLILPNTNLQTKSALELLMRTSFKYSNNVIYIEDDLSLVKNPIEYLNFCFDQFENSGEIAFSTLYTSRNHSASAGKMGRATNWPESWGFVITEKNFTLLQRQISKGREFGVGNCESPNFMMQLQLSKMTRLFFSRFRSVWLYKFNKAVNSLTAWDTEYHYGLWALNMKSIAPTTNYIEDQGIHFTSISSEKRARKAHVCKSKLEKASFQDLEDIGAPMCTRCEVALANRNYMFLPRVLRGLFALRMFG